MIKHYVTIAWRSIRKNRIFSVINILGLSTGIAFSLLIAAYVWSELKVNRSLRNTDRQYIIQSKWKNPNQGIYLTSLGPLAKALKESYPELVANYYRWDGLTSNISMGDKSFREGLQIGDSTIFNMYGFKLLYGDPNTALHDPFSVVIGEEKAVKFFGKKDVVGQVLTIENFSGSKHDFIITGVMKTPTKNSVTVLTEENNNQLYIPSNNILYFNRDMESWQHQYVVSYIELKEGVKPGDLDKPMQQLIRRHASSQVAENLTPYIVPLKDFYISKENNLVKKILYTLSAIALFILGMAIINFINITVSRSAARMREIGVRKVLGGVKVQLIVQFLTESIILVFLAMLLSLGIYASIANLFSGIIGTEIPQLHEFPFYFLVIPVLFILLLGIIAGLYPAFVLSSMKSVESLKGKYSSVKESVWMRKLLVGFQFGTAIIVFVGALIISKQISYVLGKNLGYDKDYVISLQLPRNWSPEGVRNMESVRHRFMEMPQLANATIAYQVPDGNSAGISAPYKVGADSTTAISSQLIMSDEHYAATYNIPMAAGEFFCAPGATADSSKLTINESLAKALGWSPDDAIGKSVQFQSAGPAFTIAGVTRDFHFATMQEAIQPVVFIHVHNSNVFRVLSLKIKPGNIGNTITALQTKWSELMPGVPFQYQFMDDTLRSLYKSEIRLKQASYVASILSIIIVLLGVIGLIALNIQKRTKEIGIRKVLGSSVKGIIALFMKDFLLVIFVAGMVACPLAWLLMSKWLNDYVYRIDMTAIPFLLSVLVLGSITALLIILQTVRTALANPVKSLRTE